MNKKQFFLFSGFSIIAGAIFVLSAPATQAAEVLPNLVVNNVNFYYENSAYYANPVIFNRGGHVKNTNDNLTVVLKYGNKNYEKSAKYDCDYYPCGYVFGPLSNVENANFEVTVDSDNKFEESDENDNVYIKTGGLADFIINNIKFYKNGDNYYADVTVKNIGEAVKSPTVNGDIPYTFAVVLEDKAGNYYTPQTSIRISEFPKNYTETLTFGPLAKDKRGKKLQSSAFKASVDRTKLITEINETNNSLEAKVNTGTMAAKLSKFNEYPDGTILRGPDKKIYVITSGKKKRIKTQKELSKYAGKPILDVSAEILKAVK